MVLVETGHSATAIVPRSTRGRIRDGDTAVRFEARPGVDRTHYLDAILAPGAGCLPPDVHPDGGPAIRVRLPLRSRCG